MALWTNVSTQVKPWKMEMKGAEQELILSVICPSTASWRRWHASDCQEQASPRSDPVLQVWDSFFEVCEKDGAWSENFENGL